MRWLRIIRRPVVEESREGSLFDRAAEQEAFLGEQVWRLEERVTRIEQALGANFGISVGGTERGGRA
jgi:hypothetical protein